MSAVKFPPFGTKVMAEVKFGSALEFLLDEKEILTEYKAKLLGIRINTMSKFAMLDETRAQIRSMLTTEWGFDPSKVPEARGNNASFIDAWRPRSQGSQRSGRKRQLLGHPTCPAQFRRGIR